MLGWRGRTARGTKAARAGRRSPLPRSPSCTSERGPRSGRATPEQAPPRLPAHPDQAGRRALRRCLPETSRLHRRRRRRRVQGPRSERRHSIAPLADPAGRRHRRRSRRRRRRCQLCRHRCRRRRRRRGHHLIHRDASLHRCYRRCSTVTTDSHLFHHQPHATAGRHLSHHRRASRSPRRAWLVAWAWAAGVAPPRPTPPC